MRRFLFWGAVFLTACVVSSLVHPTPAVVEYPWGKVRVEVAYRGAVAAGEVRQ